MPVTPETIAYSASEARGGRRGGYVASSSTTAKTVRATTYTPQGTNAQRSVKSTSANDAAAGTGARTIRVTYFKADCTGPFTEDITLNGTTAVATANSDIALLEKIEVLTVGSGGGNAGTINFYTDNAGAGSIWGSIAVSDNQTYWAHHYVATGATCYVTEAIVCQKANTGGAAVLGIATLNKLDPTNTAIAQRNLDISYGYDNRSEPTPLKVPIEVVGPSIIFLNVKPDANTASTAHGGFAFYEH